MIVQEVDSYGEVSLADDVLYLVIVPIEEHLQVVVLGEPMKIKGPPVCDVGLFEPSRVFNGAMIFLRMARRNCPRWVVRSAFHFVVLHIVLSP